MSVLNRYWPWSFTYFTEYSSSCQLYTNLTEVVKKLQTNEWTYQNPFKKNPKIYQHKYWVKCKVWTLIAFLDSAQIIESENSREILSWKFYLNFWGSKCICFAGGSKIARFGTVCQYQSDNSLWDTNPIVW